VYPDVVRIGASDWAPASADSRIRMVLAGTGPPGSHVVGSG
jgi:hypothetical protein